MPLVAAASGWSADPDVRNAALAPFRSINSMLLDCVEDWPNLNRAHRSELRPCALEPEMRLPACRQTFREIRGVAYSDEGDDAEHRFSEFANDEPCPVLDPVTGNCELYESRPMTCRVFGPPVRCEDGLGVCELCFQGATDKEIAACEMKADPEDLESALLKKLEKATGSKGRTIIAFCLAS